MNETLCVECWLLECVNVKRLSGFFCSVDTNWPHIIHWERRGYGFSVSITVYIILIKCISVWVKYNCFWRFLIFLAQISHLCFSRPDQAVPDRARAQIFIIFCLYCDLNGCFSMYSIVSAVFDSYAYEHHTDGATWAHITSKKPCCGVA